MTPARISLASLLEQLTTPELFDGAIYQCDHCSGSPPVYRQVEIRVRVRVEVRIKVRVRVDVRIKVRVRMDLS